MRSARHNLSTRAWLAVVLCASAGCGAAAMTGELAKAPASTSYDDAAAEGSASPPSPMVPSEAWARAEPAPSAAGGTGPSASPSNTPSTATDAVPDRGPILIYQATLHLSVYEVAETQRAIVQACQQIGGFVQQQNDTLLTVRVPAPKFRDALGRIETLGDVTHRNIEALDIGEEFRDLAIRLRNAEVIRTRLEALLGRANTVEDALRVERELERITQQIEQYKGRIRHLSDRVAFSTITVRFEARSRETIGQSEIYHLPFEWLDELGLRTLLNLQ